jgi:hypothetical protein
LHAPVLSRTRRLQCAAHGRGKSPLQRPGIPHQRGELLMTGARVLIMGVLPTHTTIGFAFLRDKAEAYPDLTRNIQWPARSTPEYPPFCCQGSLRRSVYRSRLRIQPRQSPNDIASPYRISHGSFRPRTRPGLLCGKATRNARS